jgi:hypothetical protein
LKRGVHGSDAAVAATAIAVATVLTILMNTVGHFFPRGFVSVFDRSDLVI